MVLAIALSGGVDSSVAAFLLRKRYPRMVGASHLIWPGSRCCSVEVLERAEAVCRRLGIPYFRVDLYQAFRREVVGDFIRCYLEGKTPNPCVVCNKAIRFDLFYRDLKELLSRQGLLPPGEELLFATGHYARVVHRPQGWSLEKGKDPEKDQSYMLYQVKPRMLPHLVLPLGEYRKAEIRLLAEELGLGYGAVPESQDACFVEDSYVEFIRRESGRDDLERSGEIVDLEGRVLGRHGGAIRYTVGQRRGLGLADGPWYVARIEAADNRVIVARREQARRTDFTVGQTNWFISPPQAPTPCAVKIRYQIREIPCAVEPEGEAEPEEERFRVRLKRPEIITPGQSAVFYDGQRVLGGGVIL